MAKEYYIFANYPDGEYDGSFWDTSQIIFTSDYYFTLKDKLTYKPVPDDVVIFKEFASKRYWGEAKIANAADKATVDGEEVIRFKLKEIKKWLYPLTTDRVRDQISNKDTRSRIVNITEQDYTIIINEMKNNSILSASRVEQIMSLWSKYKEQASQSQWNKNEDRFNSIIQHWNVYKEKIASGAFSLDDYTNTISNLKGKDSLPGGYLCNFLERSHSSAFGNAKPGNATRFGVKLNYDNKSYTLGNSKESATREDAEDIFNKDIKPLLASIISAKSIAEKIKIVEGTESIMKAKQLLSKIIVLEHPMNFLYLYSTKIVDQLYDEMIRGEEEFTLQKNEALLSLFKELFSLKENFNDQSLISEFLWIYSTAKSIVDSNSPNVILYGPPGTGKTYSTKKVLEFVCQGNRDRYELIQFHPSYTYEDFIEGIRPKGVTPDGNIKFELVNGVFKAFCLKAKQEPDIDYYFVIDEINRANLSTVFGETLVCIEKEYRHNPKSEDKYVNLIKTQYSTLIEQLPQEQRAALSYEMGPKGESFFGVPKNVFMIGMMNDVDKSIDSFDLALRRRFKWERRDCDYDVIQDNTLFKGNEEFENINTYVDACKKLNEFISETLALGKSYEFGHSFFMKINDIAKRKVISKSNMKNLFDLHLRPTLKEYLRAIYAEKELDRKLDDAMNKFCNQI